MSIQCSQAQEKLKHKCRLIRLPVDIYRLILDELPKKDSLALSMTCHSLREALVPILFGPLVVSVYDPWFWTDSEHCFIPASLRPYVQYVNQIQYFLQR